MQLYLRTTYPLWTRWFSVLWQEARLSWGFIAGDLSSAFVPPLLFMIAAGRAQVVGIDHLVLALVRGGLLFALYTYTFVLSNQINGVQEDVINKPFRPLAAGIVTLQGVQTRWLISMLLYTGLGWCFGVLEWVLLWQSVTLLHNFYGGSSHWLTKNFLMALGIIAQLACAWQLVAPITLMAWYWIVLMSVVIFAVIALQDLRDIRGDRAIGRHTLPLELGETRTRGLLAVDFAVLPVGLHIWLLAPGGITSASLLCSLLLAALSWTIAARVWLYRTPHADHQTYMLFTYTYCAILCSSIVLM